MTFTEVHQLSDAAIRDAIKQCRVLQRLGALPKSRTTGFPAHVADYMLDEWAKETTGRNWIALVARIEALLPLEDR